jgi:hypothetical protein
MPFDIIAVDPLHRRPSAGPNQSDERNRALEAERARVERAGGTIALEKEVDITLNHPGELGGANALGINLVLLVADYPEGSRVAVPEPLKVQVLDHEL